MGGGAAGAPDLFYKEAQHLGYVARSTFKLVQIQKQHKLIKAGSSVLDLGCAPGAWLQVACQSLGPPNHGGSVLGIDLKVTQTSISLFHGNTADIVEMFFSRLGMVPVIALVGFELFNRGFLVVGSCIEIGIPMLILFIALSQDKGITRQIPSKTKRSTHDHVGSMPKQSAIRTRIVVMAGQEGPTITRTKRKSATQHGGSTLLDLLQALEDYFPVLLGLVNDEDDAEANFLLLPRSSTDGYQLKVSEESRRASVDIFLKAAGYLDCAVKHVLPQLPAELRRNLPVDLISRRNASSTLSTGIRILAKCNL
ncbi:Ribosomal RNA large subunit methyltransferase E [Arachis hypogaea]|uniref:Ribosomal RNA large subunit methyltransferase E n=1 Tax=Arachis hypogaea TaxID=3818 RepID=A0A6B9VBW1_ARAHY|nr:Ribosomal RNA large subunit methyltransferase E [Arachis hypogaea]